MSPRPGRWSPPCARCAPQRRTCRAKSRWTPSNEVLGEDVQLVLLDNFPVWQTQIAVQRRDATAPGVQLESSGGLSLETAAQYAGTGVDYLAVGALTHSVRVLDIGLDM